MSIERSDPSPLCGAAPRVPRRWTWPCAGAAICLGHGLAKTLETRIDSSSLLPSAGFALWCTAGLALLGPLASFAFARIRALRSGSWLLALCLASAYRSSRAEASPATPGSLPAHGTAPTAGSLRGGERVRVGRWLPVSPSGRRGTLSGQPERIYVWRGGAPYPGENIAIAAGVSDQPLPCGPVPGPNAGRGRAEILPDEVRRLPPRTGAIATLLRGARNRWHAARALALSNRTSQIPERSRPLYRAALLGDRSALSSATADLFTRTGVRHLLAVSGLHVGVLAMVLVGPVSALALRSCSPPARRWGLAWVRGLALLAYAALAGGGAPVLRAATVLSLAGFAALVRRPLWGNEASPWVGRRATGLSLLGVALCIEAMVDPAGLSHVGLQLSFAATFGILIALRPTSQHLLEATEGARDELSLSISPLRSTAHHLFRRWRRSAAQALAVSLCACLATLPWMWCTFGEVSPIGALLTLPALVPLTALLLLGSAELLWPGLLPRAWLDVPNEVLTTLLTWADRVPGTPAVLPERPTWLIALLVALTLVFIAARTRDGRDKGTPRPLRTLTLIGWGAVLLPWTCAPRALEVHALSVGHGTCVVWRAPGAGVWVFDAGSRDRRHLEREALAPLLRRWEVTRAHLVVSHKHADHISSIPWLIERYPPLSFAGALPRSLRARLPPDCPRWDTPRGSVALDGGPLTRVTLGRGSSLRGNEGSRALRVQSGHQAIALCGDAEGLGLRGMMDDGFFRAPLRMLLAPHHGSAFQLMPDLLRCARPQEVWLSASTAADIEPELTRRGIETHTTANGRSLRLDLPARHRPP